MSYTLGIYSKKSNIATDQVNEILSDFSLGNRRSLKTKISGKLLLSAMKDRYGNFNIAENEDKSLIILFGGEIYDFGSLAEKLIKKGHKFQNESSSAELALHSFEEYGAEFLEKINGAFAFSIYDKRKDELTFANDTFGIFPLFIYNASDILIFSSEYQPILNYAKFDKKFDHDAIAEYFALGSVLGDKTFFKNIKNLRPASVLTIKNSVKKIRNYDNFGIKITKNKDLDYFAGLISESVRNAVKSRINNAEKVAYDLSGGADTRLILSCLTKEQRKNAEFITLNHQLISESMEKDVIIAKILAKKLNLDLTILKRPYYSFEKFFKKVRREKLRQVKRISALHGGEFLGGDCFKYCLPNLSEIDRSAIDKRLERIFHKSFLERISHPYDSLKKELKNIKAENRGFLFAVHQFTRSFYTRIYGAHDGFLTPYIFAAATDSPFWDKNLLKLLLTVPKEYLLDYKLYNHMYKHHFPELIGIPTNSPLAFSDDSCMHYFGKGIDRKEIKQAGSNGIIIKRFKNSHMRKKQFYKMDYLTSLDAKPNLLSIKLKNFILKRKNKIFFRYLVGFAMKNKHNMSFFNKYMHSVNLKEKKQMDNKSLLESFADFEAWNHAILEK